MMSVEGEDPTGKELDALAANISRILEQEDEKLYSREVIEEFRNPSNIGRLEDADGSGVADGLCGDTMEFYIKVRSGRVSECRFYTDGCGPTIACGSRLSRFVQDMDLDSAQSISPKDLVSLLHGLPPDHEHCASLAVIALRSALRDFHTRREAKQGGGR